MKMYMVCAGQDSEEGALLVFAHTAREARKLAWQKSHWLSDWCDYIDVRATLIKTANWLWAEADKEKLAQDIPHIVDEPLCCEDCWRWGHSPVGADYICDECREEIREDESGK